MSGYSSLAGIIAHRGMFSSLRVKVAGFLLFALIGTLLIILINTWFHYQSLKQKIEQDALYLSARATGSAARIVDAQVSHLQLLARAAHSAQFDRRLCETDIFGFLQGQTRYLAMGIALMDGKTLCVGTRSGQSVDSVNDRDWFIALREGRQSAFQVAYGRVSNRAVLIAGIRVQTPNLPPTIAFSSIDLTWVGDVLRLEAADTNNTTLSMLDASGRMLVHTGVEGDIDIGRRAPELWAAASAGAQQVTATDIDGVTRQFNITPIRQDGQTLFYLLAGVDVSTAADQALEGLHWLIAPYLLFTILVVVLGILFAERGLHRPIKAILASVGRYAGGDHGARIGPPYLRGEIGMLGRALDQLTDAVEQHTLEVSRSHQRALAAQGRTEALIAASPVPIVCLDAELRAMFWNPAAEKVFGYSAREVIGHVPPIIPPEDMKTAQANVARVFKGETMTVDMLRQHKDGSVLEVRASIAPLRDEAGMIDGAVAIFVDETDRRLVERQFAQAQKMEAIGQLTGGLSHDFNNLLGVIIGNMDFILDEAENQPQLKAFAESAMSAALQGAELNKRLLAFARRQPLVPEVIRLGEEIGNILGLLKRTLGEHIQVKSRVGPDVWPVVVDPSQLQASVINLGVNARDAMPGGGILEVEVTNRIFDTPLPQEDGSPIPVGRYVVLSVSDTGTGMPPEVLKHIFEPFYTTKEVGKGSGLGLSMVYGFVKQSGGHITCYSEPGKGTTFRLYLPCADGEAVPRDTAVEADRMSFTRKINILLVEDNADLRQVASQQLTQIGGTVTEAADAAAALIILKSNADIDAMLSDIVMPGGMDGRQLAAEAARIRPGLKIMLMSGYSDPRMERRDGGQSEDEWPLLTKPFRRRELLEALLELLPELRSGDTG